MGNSQDFEVSPKARHAGYVFYAGDNLQCLKTMPVCVLGVADLEYEIRQLRPKLNFIYGILEEDYLAARDVLASNRQCPKWTRHIWGLGPREHLEKLRQLEMEESRRTWETEQALQQRRFMMQLAEQDSARAAKVEEQRRAYEKDMEDDRRKWVSTQNDIRDKDQRRVDNLMIGLTLAAVILAAIQLGTASPDSPIGKLIKYLSSLI